MSQPIGLIGGLAWPSTALYYQHINRGYQAARGGAHSAPLLLWSFDFEEINALKAADDWQGIADVLGHASAALAKAGAGALVLCTNTLHKLHRALEDAAGLPLLHIADAVGTHLKAEGVETVGLLGTRFTMTEAFYRDRLASHGIEVAPVCDDDVRTTNGIIYTELVKEQVSDVSRERMRAVVGRLKSAGAQAAILGCTELSLLEDGGSWPLPLVDTVRVHSEAAVDWLLTAN